jgi:hypothetical protein
VSKIFLGRWWHWALLIVLCAVLWIAGDNRMHVIHFNQFVSALLAGVCVILAIVLVGTRPGEQVTRDVLEMKDPD